MMMNKYLLSIPAAGGRYGLTIGAARVIVKQIRRLNPDAEIHYSGVSSGAISAVLSIIADAKEHLFVPIALPMTLPPTDVTNDTMVSPILSTTSTTSTPTSFIQEPFHEKMHREMLDMVKQEGEWKTGVREYFRNNEYFFNGLIKFIKYHLIDIDQINDKVHIGYCKLSSENGMEFKIVSKFTDVDDLIGALLASSHYSWVLKNSNYYEYRGDRCVDGIFMYDRFSLPGYQNIIIDEDVFTDTARMEALLEPSQEKFIRLYRLGEERQTKKELNFFVVDKGPASTNGFIKTTWSFINKTSALIASTILIATLIGRCVF